MPLSVDTSSIDVASFSIEDVVENYATVAFATFVENYTISAENLMDFFYYKIDIEAQSGTDVYFDVWVNSLLRQFVNSFPALNSKAEHNPDLGMNICDFNEFMNDYSKNHSAPVAQHVRYCAGQMFPGVKSLQLVSSKITDWGINSLLDIPAYSCRFDARYNANKKISNLLNYDSENFQGALDIPNFENPLIGIVTLGMVYRHFYAYLLDSDYMTFVIPSEAEHDYLEFNSKEFIHDLKAFMNEMGDLFHNPDSQSHTSIAFVSYLRSCLKNYIKESIYFQVVRALEKENQKNIENLDKTWKDKFKSIEVSGSSNFGWS